MLNPAEVRPLRVALVNMPFSSARFPSIQLGLLQSILQERGFPTTTLYPNLEFGALVGWKQYEALSDTTLFFTGDWIFARAAFRERAPDGRLFLERFGKKLSKTGSAFLWRLHEHGAQTFLQNCLTSSPWHQFDVVGFSSVFVQNCAALALARLLKERYPSLITVFGGANFEDEMGLELVRACPWIDYAVVGEGDESFPALLDRLASGTRVNGLRGIAYRSDGRVEYAGAAPLVQKLDALPSPNYDEFFATAARLRMPSALVPDGIQLPYESARGCWWGEKQHCTFCGLNAAGMAYRSKSAERVVQEIETLSRRYRTKYLGAVDNILDHRHVDGVFGTLAQKGAQYRFFYEVKANLRKEQIELLAQGGVRRVQPGIESLSTHILKLMKKGITGIKNVRFLKWATAHGIHSSWNLLFGFPGETEEDYARQLEVVALIPHLPPPTGAFRISLQRFSPNYTRAQEMGFENIRPVEAYKYIYPEDVDKKKVAYFFDYDAPGTLRDAAYVPLHAALRSWQKAWRRKPLPSLQCSESGGVLTISDGRKEGTPVVHSFSGEAAAIHGFCSLTDRSLATVVDHLRERGTPLPADDVAGLLTTFHERGLMMEEDGHYLSLALPSDVAGLS